MPTIPGPALTREVSPTPSRVAIPRRVPGTTQQIAVAGGALLELGRIVNERQKALQRKEAETAILEQTAGLADEILRTSDPAEAPEIFMNQFEARTDQIVDQLKNVDVINDVNTTRRRLLARELVQIRGQAAKIQETRLVDVIGRQIDLAVNQFATSDDPGAMRNALESIQQNNADLRQQNLISARQEQLRNLEAVIDARGLRIGRLTAEGNMNAAQDELAAATDLPASVRARLESGILGARLQLISILERKENAERRQLEQGRQQNTRDIMQRIVDARSDPDAQPMPSDTEFLRLFADNRISESQVKFLQAMKVAARNPNVSDDPQLALKLLDAALLGQDVRGSIRNHVGDDISLNTAEALTRTMDEARRRGGILARNDVQSGKRNLQLVLTGSTGPLAALDPDRSARLVNAWNEYTQRILELQKQGKPIDGIALSEEIAARFRTIPETFLALPVPRFSQGGVDRMALIDPVTRREIKQRTLEAFDNGDLDEHELDRELQLLEEYDQMFEQMARQVEAAKRARTQQ